MASPTYNVRALVLRKTRLSESDLIVTFLSESGAQLRAVAKGARKPTSQFASRLELFSEVDVLSVEGRNLDVVKEARLVRGHDGLRISLEHATAAAPMAELLERVTQQDLEEPRLFQASSVAFSSLEDAPASMAPALAGAHLLKTLAFAGLRPSLDTCAVCGTLLDLAHTPTNARMRFSFSEGGAVCVECAHTCETLPVQAGTIAWAHAFLGSSFADLAARSIPLDASFAVLRLAQGLVREHVGARLKSLEFLFSCGLFADDVK